MFNQKMDQLLFKNLEAKKAKLINRLILLTCLFFISMHAIAEQNATIISSNSNRYLKSIAQSTQLNLEKSNIQIYNFDLDQQGDFNINSGLLISIGNKANKFLDDKNLSNTQLRVIKKIDQQKDFSGENKFYLSMTHSQCKQFKLIRVLNDEWETVSILLSSRNINLTHQLESCAAEFKLKVKIIIISEYLNIIDALNSSLSDSDILLALPDPSVYNVRTIKSILLTTYRHRVPVIGFSESFVHAGALAAIHSSSKQIGIQVAELIKQYNNDKKIDSHYIYPEYFDVSINHNVAKSLKISVPDKALIKEQLKSQSHE